MSTGLSDSGLPAVQRVVTGHDENGRAIFKSEDVTPTTMIPSGEASFLLVWTTATVPADNNDEIDGRDRPAGLGGIDILVCNAGITGKPGPFSTIDMDDYDRVMALNLCSSVVLTGLALPHIAEGGGGSVILIASLSALRGNGAINAYALSKAGLAQLARNLAVEWGPRQVRANAISPGFIATELSAPLLADDAFMARRMQLTPLRRPGTPREIAGAALFLASDAGAFVTGHNLVVDGGTLI
jgi:NAD(P)-dependent dehydrogenase (short-subunit alcohol dehydrogenase family)